MVSNQIQVPLDDSCHKGQITSQRNTFFVPLRYKTCGTTSLGRFLIANRNYIAIAFLKPNTLN